MGGDQGHDAKTVVHCAELPWHVPSAPWRQIEAQLPQDQLAREMRQAMTRLDCPALSDASAGRGQAPHRPDWRRASVRCATRRGQRQPRPWLPDTQEHGALGWWGCGMRPARRGWYAWRDRPGPSLDTRNEHGWPQAVAEEGSRGERGAWEGSAVAAHASRRRLSKAARLTRRLPPRQAAGQAEAHGPSPDDVPAWMAHPSHPRTAPSQR
jgi:hypothetical protein